MPSEIGEPLCIICKHGPSNVYACNGWKKILLNGNECCCRSGFQPRRGLRRGTRQPKRIDPLTSGLLGKLERVVRDAYFYPMDQLATFRMPAYVQNAFGDVLCLTRN